MRTLITLVVTTYLLSASSYETGENLYFQKGCNNCHGANAEGMHEFPKLANQKRKDLVRKLYAYRMDAIKTPQASVMTGYAKALTQSETESIIYYLEHFKEVVPTKRYDDSYQSWGDGGS